jgi:hypothetical protein
MWKVVMWHGGLKAKDKKPNRNFVSINGRRANIAKA